MIELYTAATPNGRKIHILLEETGLAYRTTWVDLRQGDQLQPEFPRISPNNRIPALVDPVGPDGEPIALFESGAVLIYLAEKTGRFLHRSGEPLFRYPLRPHFVKVRVRLHDDPDGTLAIFHGPRCLARYRADGSLLDHDQPLAA